MAVVPLIGEILIDDRSAPLHDRFENDPSFIAASYDLSGLARSNNTQQGRWATLISPNMVISAEHFPPRVGDTLTFFEANDASGASLQANVVAQEQMGTSDVWIGLLDRNMPATYSPMPLWNESLTTEADFQGSSLNEAEAFLVGRSNDLTFQVTNMAFGRNRLDYWWDSYSEGSRVDVAIGAVRERFFDTGYMTYEAFLQLYDSGAPLLVYDNGVLTIVGMNWFIDNLPVQIGNQTRQRDVNGFSYVGNHTPAIEVIIDTYSEATTDGYLAWVQSAFPAGNPLSNLSPLMDFDLDGRSNLLEYAFITDPANPSELPQFVPTPVDDGGQRYLTTTLSVRTDPELLYTVQVGDTPDTPTEVSLSFNGSTWISSDPALLEITLATDDGDGKWTLGIKEGTPIQLGVPRFLRPGVQTTVP